MKKNRRMPGRLVAGRRRAGRDFLFLDHGTTPADDTARRIARARCRDSSAPHVARPPFRPEEQVEDETDDAKDEEDPTDGVDVDLMRSVRMYRKRQDEPDGGDDEADCYSHVQRRAPRAKLQP